MQPQQANPGYLTRRAARAEHHLNPRRVRARPPGAAGPRRAGPARPRGPRRCGGAAPGGCTPAEPQPRIRCPQGHAAPWLNGGGQVRAPVTCGKNRRKPGSGAPSPASRFAAAAAPLLQPRRPLPLRASPAMARNPAVGAKRSNAAPAAAPLLAPVGRRSAPSRRRRAYLGVAGPTSPPSRRPGRGAREPAAARSPKRTRSPRSPLYPRPVGPAAPPPPCGRGGREEGGRERGRGKSGDRIGEGRRGHRRGERRGRRRKEGGRGRLPRPRRLTGRNQRFAFLAGAPAAATAAPRGPPASFPPQAPGSAERAAEPQRRRATATGAGRHRAGRSGAQRSARLPPPPTLPARRGHSLVRSHRPPPLPAPQPPVPADPLAACGAPVT